MSIHPIDPIDPSSRSHSVMRLIALHLQIEEMAKRQTSLFEADVERERQAIDQLEAEKLERLRRQGETSRSETLWQTAANVAGYVVSSGMIGVGAVLVASGQGAVPGWMFIASGVTGLAGKVLHDTGLHLAAAARFTQSIELQKKIAATIEMGTLTLSLGLGLAGGAWGYAIGGLDAINQASSLEKAISAVTMTAGLVRGGAEVRKAFLKKETAHLEGAHQIADLQREEHNQKLEEITQEMQETLELVAQSSERLRETISLTAEGG